MGTIRARVRNGRIESVDRVHLPDGTELEVIIITSPEADHRAFLASFNTWKGTMEPDDFLTAIRESRQATRPTPRL